MPKYRVILYPVVAVAIDNVEADDIEAAIEKAHAAADLNGRFCEGAANHRHSQEPCLFEFIQYCDTDAELVQEYAADQNDLDWAREVEFNAAGEVVSDTAAEQEASAAQ